MSAITRLHGDGGDSDELLCRGDAEAQRRAVGQCGAIPHVPFWGNRNNLSVTSLCAPCVSAMKKLAVRGARGSPGALCRVGYHTADGDGGDNDELLCRGDAEAQRRAVGQCGAFPRCFLR